MSRRPEALWRSVFQPRVAAVHLPLAVLASFIAVDAPGIPPGEFPSELAWYAIVTGCALVALALVAIAGISDAAARSPHRAPPPVQQPAA